MKKSIIIIFAIAVIGALGMAARHHDDGASLAAPAGGGTSMSDTSNTNTGTAGTSQPTANSTFKDGTYTGQSEFTPYGMVQVAAVVSGGKITDVKFLKMPGPEGHSKEVTSFAEPYLKDETLQNQSANISFVSGATTTSEAYSQSLQAALDQAA